MNCNSVRKFLFAFADGELDVHNSCEVLDHLKMCVACSEIVNEHQAMRRAVRRQIESTPIPTELANRVQMTLARPLSVHASRWTWFSRISAMAACLVCGFTIGWMVLNHNPRAKDESGGGLAVPRRAVAIASNDPTLLRVASAHKTRAEMGQNDPAAIRGSLRQVKATLSDRYGQNLAIMTPNLSRLGYQFDSATPCLVHDGEQRAGVQLLYASADHSRTLSLFCIPRRDKFEAGRLADQGDGPRYFEIGQPSGESLGIGVWHKDATTFLMCSQLPVKRLERLVEATRTGMVDLK